jgi:hypothetical protein
MTQFYNSSNCLNQQKSECFKTRSTRMNISGFVMHEPRSLIHMKLPISAFLASLQSFFGKFTIGKTARSDKFLESAQQDLAQQDLAQQEPSWYGQSAHKKLKTFKLSYFGGIPTAKITKLLRKIHLQHLNLQYAGLAMLSVPALIQVAVQPLTYDPNSLTYDPMQTSSIPSKPDFWSKGWKTFYGRALQSFSIETPETAGMMLTYTARSHISGLREDMMSWRKSNADKLPQALMVVQKDMPPQGYDSPNIQTEITKRSKAMELSLIKVSSLSTIPSKFGPVEVLDVTLADKSKGQHACVAFRTQSMQPNLKLSGWLCGEQSNAIERPQVSCFINRLDIMGATQDASMQRIFKNADAQRGNCTSRTSYMQANYGQESAKKGSNWLEIKNPLPSLKGVITGR